MSYLARLVRQSGLRISGEAPRGVVAVAEDGREPDGIEEVAGEMVTTPPPPSPVTGASSPVAEAPKPANPPAPAPREEPITGEAPPERPAPVTTIEVTEVHEAARDAPGVSPLELRPERSTPPDVRESEVQRTITRHETLRRVIDWITPNDRLPVSEVIEKRDPHGEAPDPPKIDERVAALEAPHTGTPPERHIVLRERPEPHVPPAPRVEIAEPSEFAVPHPAPEPRESGTEVTIGTLNLSVEAPPQTTVQPPVATVPVPPPSALPRPAAPFSTASAADRLRRRYMRV